jgi:DNA-binding response OmpR family regulator
MAARNVRQFHTRSVRVCMEQMHSVLWIDDQICCDDPAIRVLHMEGFLVDCASHANEGITLARSRPYDAILLDLDLPDMPGL